MANRTYKLLDAVTGTGAGSWVKVAEVRGILVTHSASSTPVFTVTIEGKNSDGTAVVLDSRSISAAGDTVVEVPVGFTEIRSNVTAYTSGTLSSYLNAA